MLARSALRSGFLPSLTSSVKTGFCLRAAAPTLSMKWSAVKYYSTKHFTKEHEWVKVDGDVGTVGITSYAANALGEVVFVELPEPETTVSVGDGIGAVESVKSASDVYSPVSGTVTSINESLGDSPDKVSSSPEEEGWICKIKLSSPDELKSLLNDESYAQFCKEEDASH
ncbi:putative glycine cleavage system H protein, mitochondrial [Schizosaccharomyces pombe]